MQPNSKTLFQRACVCALYHTGFPISSGERLISLLYYQWPLQNSPKVNGSLMYIFISEIKIPIAFWSSLHISLLVSLINRSHSFNTRIYYYIVSNDFGICGQTVRFDFNEQIACTQKLLQFLKWSVWVFSLNSMYYCLHLAWNYWRAVYMRSGTG